MCHLCGFFTFYFSFGRFLDKMGIVDCKMRRGSAMTHEDWYESLEPAILIKVEDFHLLSYREIKPEHIWSFLTEVKWAKNPTPNLHERVNDIMQMNIGQLMDFITKASKGPAISASTSNETFETEKTDDDVASLEELSK